MGYQIECVVEAANHLGEGPLWDVEEGVLYWLDGTGRRVNKPSIWRLDPRTGTTRNWSLEHDIGAMALRKDGGAAGHFYTELSRAYPTSHGCPWVEGGLYVNRHGDVTTCCMVKDTDRFALGRIGEASDRQILDARSRIGDALSQGQVPEQCTGCGYISGMAARQKQGRA